MRFGIGAGSGILLLAASSWLCATQSPSSSNPPASAPLVSAAGTEVYQTLCASTCKILVNYVWSGESWIEELASSYATGVVFDDQGWVLTAGHVVANARRVVVICPDGIGRAADRWSRDIHCDIGVIHVPDWRGVPATQGSPTDLRIGDEIFTLGHPLGFESSMMRGLVGGMHRGIMENGRRPFPIMNYIQSDAETNRGSSGGGLFLRDGRLVGVNVSSLNVTREGAGMTFSVPIVQANAIAQALIAGTDIALTRCAGLSLRTLYGAPADVLPHARSLDPNAVLISALDSAHFPWQGDLFEGDVILAIGGIPVVAVDQVFASLYVHAPHKPLDLSVVRDGIQLTVSLTFPR